jgi:hypothetical protein
MKNILLIIMMLCLLETANSQEFSFQMFFSDAIGNKDTITLGYDALATDDIDAAFGEVNLITLPLDTTLDVRVTNEWQNRNHLGIPGTFHTKKQITFYECNPFSNLQTLDIYTKHWPVKVSWDSTLFNGFCLKGSVFTSQTPGGWWDTGCPSDLWRQELVHKGEVTFTSNFQQWFEPYFSYINDSNDTIPVFWQIFADTTILYVGANDFTTDRQQAVISPNPAMDKFTIQVPAQFGIIVSVEIFSSTGKLVLKTTKTNDINSIGFERGLYLVTVTNSLGGKLAARMIRK